jgi:hypothetical protein
MCAACKRQSNKTSVFLPVNVSIASLPALPSLLEHFFLTRHNFAFRSDRPVTTVNLLGFSRQQRRMPCPCSLAGAVFFALQWVTDFVAGGLQALMKLEQKVAELLAGLHSCRHNPRSGALCRLDAAGGTAEQSFLYEGRYDGRIPEHAASCQSQGVFRRNSTNGLNIPGLRRAPRDHRRMIWGSIRRCVTGLLGHTRNCWCRQILQVWKAMLQLWTGAVAELRVRFPGWQCPRAR